MVSRRQVLQMVSGVSVAGLAGCFGGGDPEGSNDGGGDGDNGTTEQVGLVQTTRRPSVIGTSTAAEAFPSYDWALLEGQDIVDTNTVEVTKDGGTLFFEPFIARVPLGTTVTWENTTTGRHTVTVPRKDFSEFVFSGSSVELTFDEPGVYNYVCRNHSPEHIGRIVVDESLTPYPGSGGTETGDGMGGTETDTSG